MVLFSRKVSDATSVNIYWKCKNQNHAGNMQLDKVKLKLIRIVVMLLLHYHIDASISAAQPNDIAVSMRAT